METAPPRGRFGQVFAVSLGGKSATTSHSERSEATQYCIFQSRDASSPPAHSKKYHNTYKSPLHPALALPTPLHAQQATSAPSQCHFSILHCIYFNFIQTQIASDESSLTRSSTTCFCHFKPSSQHRNPNYKIAYTSVRRPRHHPHYPPRQTPPRTRPRANTPHKTLYHKYLTTHKKKPHHERDAANGCKTAHSI